MKRTWPPSLALILLNTSLSKNGDACNQQQKFLHAESDHRLMVMVQVKVLAEGMAARHLMHMIWYVETDRETERQTERQTDRRTDRPTDGRILNCIAYCAQAGTSMFLCDLCGCSCSSEGSAYWLPTGIMPFPKAQH